MTISLTDLHERLRRDTATMLNYDYDNLTAAQSVRLDRAAMLRLELDDCQAKKLAGQPFDTNKYIAASEALERMFNGGGESRPSVGVDPLCDQFLADIDRAIAAKEYALAENPAQARAELQANIQRAIAKHPQPASGDALLSDNRCSSSAALSPASAASRWRA
jgi:hypothetical protein